MKVYITKYALTKGIIEREDWRFYGSDKSYIYIKEYYLSYKVGKDAFFDRKEAVKNAYERRDKKVSELKKQIEKFEKLKFE